MNKTAISAMACVVMFFGIGWQMRSSTAARPSSGGDSTAQHSSLGTLVDPDAYAVYEALLDPKRGGAGARLGAMAIEGQTKSRELCFDPSAQRDPQFRDAATNYIRLNSQPELLKADQLNLGKEVQFISSSEMDEMFSKGVMKGWEIFHKNHPKLMGTIQLSAVGFSADKNFAVVYSASHCGPKCAAGGIVTLSRKDGVWRKNGDRICSWIS
jgi:hypothetical protein